jgi:hypothetical protein
MTSTTIIIIIIAAAIVAAVIVIGALYMLLRPATRHDTSRRASPSALALYRGDERDPGTGPNPRTPEPPNSHSAPSSHTEHRFEINGQVYDSLDDIPDPAVRERIRKLMATHNNQPGSVTREVTTRSTTVKIEQRDGRTDIIVNGTRYRRVEDIPDPDLRAKAQELIARARSRG